MLKHIQSLLATQRNYTITEMLKDGLRQSTYIFYRLVLSTLAALFHHKEEANKQEQSTFYLLTTYITNEMNHHRIDHYGWDIDG